MQRWQAGWVWGPNPVSHLIDPRLSRQQMIVILLGLMLMSTISRVKKAVSVMKSFSLELHACNCQHLVPLSYFGCLSILI